MCVCDSTADVQVCVGQVDSMMCECVGVCDSTADVQVCVGQVNSMMCECVGVCDLTADVCCGVPLTDS